MKQKLLLVLFGVFLSFVIVEISLRIAGAAYLYLAEQANQSSLSKNNEVKIMCLGESTTAGGEESYPRQLEGILNSRSSKKKFSVINKGIPAITTDTIIDQLPQNLAQYKPDMVIIMMGINDEAFFSHQDKNSSPLMRTLNSLQTVKLIRFLVEHLRHKSKEIKTAFKEEKSSGPSEEELKTALAKDPQNYSAWLNLGLFYKSQSRNALAIEAFNKALSLISDHQGLDQAILLWCLAECYKVEGQHQRAIEYYQKVLEMIPNHSRAWADLAEVYIQMEDYSQAEVLLARQIAIQPKEVHFYSLLMHCYKQQKKFDQVEALLQFGIRTLPTCLDLYQMLGYFYMEQQRYREAEEAFLKVLTLDPDNKHNLKGHIARQLAIIYEHLPEPQKASKVKESLNEQPGVYSQHTRENYLRLIDTLKAKRIPFMIMQYPLRDPQLLSEQLRIEGVIYVDNRQPFEKIVKEKGYGALFVDHFAGDFGHCNFEGNRILANNAAKAVLKYFDH